MTPCTAQAPEPWHIHFFQRAPADDPSSSTPALDYLSTAPMTVVAEFHAILEAVAAAPPPSFSGGGKWEAMHGDMTGIFEVRVRSRGTNYRLFCLLIRSSDRIAAPSVVCLDGITKPARTAAPARDYQRIRRYAAEFRTHERVLA